MHSETGRNRPALQHSAASSAADSRSGGENSRAATAITRKSISLAWDDLSTNETGCYVERSLDGVTWVRIATLAANTTVYTNSGLTAKTTYHYRVQAFNADGVTAYTNIVTVTTPK